MFYKNGVTLQVCVHGHRKYFFIRGPLVDTSKSFSRVGGKSSEIRFSPLETKKAAFSLKFSNSCPMWQFSSNEEDNYTFRTIPQEHWSIGMSMARPSWCCDRKSRAAYAQSFALWQQATIEFTCHDHSVTAYSRHIYVWCCSSRTSRSWWNTQSTQHHRRGCNINN